MVGLGDLPGGIFESIAYDVSADGSVVVGTSSGGGAFIWDATNGMRNFKDVLENTYGLDLTGWTLSTANGISDDGKIIAGYGSGPSGTEAWIARIYYDGGEGTQGNPFEINTPAQMNEIGQNPEDWDKYFILTADIDLSDYTGAQYNIIGDNTTNFTGIFNGNDHTISNFSYTPAEPNSIGIGLFGYVCLDGEIKDLGLVNSNVNAGTGIYVGTLAGSNCGTISNCYVAAGTVDGDYCVGALVGYNQGNSWISRCYATGSVQGGYSVGGLVGENTGFATIADCYATASVVGDDKIGGLLGWNDDPNSYISDCYATGLATGNTDVGGLAGANNGGVIDSFFDVETGGPDNGIGTPKTTKQMKTASTFFDVNWDLVATWNIEELQTYPLLRRYLAVDLDYDNRVDLVDFAKFAQYWLEGVQ